MLILTLTVWTSLLGQTGNYLTKNDTVKCYNAPELRKIAAGLIRYRQCDTLLKITEDQVISYKTVIDIKDIIIKNDSTIIAKQKQQLVDMYLEKSKYKSRYRTAKWIAITCFAISCVSFTIR